MPTNLDFLIARVSAHKTILTKKDPKDIKGNVSFPFANDFNSLLEEIKKECPEAASHLPRAITFESDRARLAHQSDINFVELEIMVEQVLNVLQTLKSDH